MEHDRQPLYLVHPEYVSSLKPLEPIFRLTRMPQRWFDAKSLLDVQEHLVARVLALTKNVREGKRLIDAAKTRGELEEVEFLEMRLGANRHLLRLIHMIMDGMAWRMLGFDRPFLRLASEPDRHLGSVAFPGMKTAAQQMMAANGSRVLFNDLTNTLRLGDLTEFLPDGRIVLHELKGSGMKVKNVFTVAKMKSGAVSRQVEHMVTAQIVPPWLP